MRSEVHTSLLFHQTDDSSVPTRIIDILVYILIVLGLIGNILGLFIFSSSRRTWRISWIYVRLATTSSIINLFCVARYAFLLHSAGRAILWNFVGTNRWACKLYECSFGLRAISAWVSLFWMFERVLCVSIRLQSLLNRVCRSRFTFVIPFLIVLVLLACVIGPPVYFYEPTLISEDLIDAAMDKDRTYCDLPRSASPWLQEYFHQIHLGFNHFTVRCLFTELIPTGAVLIFNTYIIYYLIRIDRGIYRDEHRTMSWMNGVLLIHSSLLLGSLFAHIVGHFTVPEAHETWWVLLAILINSSLNFYLYCLSGKAFRDEILRFINHLFCHAQSCCHDDVYSDESVPNQIRIQLRTVHFDD